MSFVYSKMLVTVNHKKMTKFLNDKRILFISTKYYGYQKEILNGLREAGATVEFYYDDPFDYLSFINSRVLQQKLGKGIKIRAYNKFRSYILQKTSEKQYDFVFVLKGSLITIPFLKSLQAKHPGTIFIQYQWDSINNFHYEHYLPYFDLSFSFDPSDAARIDSIQYLPMFARNEFFGLNKERLKTNQDFDVLFVGTSHSNRLLTIRKLKDILRQHNLKFKFYVYLPFFMGLKGVFLTRRLKRDELMFKTVGKKQLKQLLLRSRYVLDLPSLEQSGITPRALEALAAGCSLITTNESIRDAPFFDEKYITIINPDCLSSLPLILSNRPDTQIQLNLDQYSLNNWLKVIFQTAMNVKKQHILAAQY